MSWQKEIQEHNRFSFGSNWANFLNNLTDIQIENAKIKLQEWLGEDLDGKTFLDIGSGSGLHSLCARMLGAKVISFDYDFESVECTKYLKEKYFKEDTNWGVLHHTGSMWEALENAIIPVKETNGVLFVAIYNTQTYWTKYWTLVKKTYNANIFMKTFWIYFYIVFNTFKGVVKDLLLFQNPLQRYREYKEDRGMSIYYDLIDWLGGYPFETAKPEEIFEFYKKYNFQLEKLYTAGGGMACNEFLFKKKI